MINLCGSWNNVSSDSASTSVIHNCQKKKKKMQHQTAISYAWIYTLVPLFKARISALLNYSLWSLFTKPAEDESGLCSYVIGRRRKKGETQWSGKEEGINKAFSWRENKRNTKTAETKERQCEERRGDALTSRRNAPPPPHSCSVPRNQFQHIKFGLTTIAEL